MTILRTKAYLIATAFIALSIADTVVASDIPPSSPAPDVKAVNPPFSIEMVNGELLMTDLKTGERFTFFRLPKEPNRIQLAASGGSDRGGGDPRIVWREVLGVKKAPRFSVGVLTYAVAFFLSDDANNFRNRIAFTAGTLEASKIADSNSRKIFLDMRARGLVDDIKVSRVVLQNRCPVKNTFGHQIYRSASAVNSQPGTDICVDPVLFAGRMERLAYDSVIFGLMMHEYARHFGYEDESHSLAVSMALALEKTLIDENIGRPPPNEPVLTLVAKSVAADWKSKSHWAKEWQACIRARNCF